MLLEDRTRNVVYVAFSRDLIGPLLNEWSDPVQVMVEHVPGNTLGDDMALVFRKVAVRFDEVAAVGGEK